MISLYMPLFVLGINIVNAVSEVWKKLFHVSVIEELDSCPLEPCQKPCGNTMRCTSGLSGFCPPESCLFGSTDAFH